MSLFGFGPLGEGPLGNQPSQSNAVVVPIRIGDLSDADKYSPTWQLLMGAPKRLLLAGQTVAAVSPPPNDEYTIVLDVVRNAPVPIADADVLQVGADIFDAILDLAQHIALFKEGPGQLEQSLALLARAADVAGVDLGLQQAAQPARSPLMNQTRTDEHSLSRELPVVEIE